MRRLWAQLAALRIGQDDPPNAKRGQLGPEPAHHLRPRQSQEQVHARTRRPFGFEDAPHRECPLARGGHGPGSVRAVEQSDALVSFLVSRGAKLDLKDRQGRTALDLALAAPPVARGGRPRGGDARETTAALLRQLSAGSVSK